MDNFDYSAIGQRIKVLRKKKKLNQQELADLLGKSLRTVQKYETGEIEVSIAIINQLADLLDSTPTFILGYETNTEPIRNLADVMSFLFQLEKVSGMKLDIDVKKPPRSRDWKCSLTFNGKASAYFNADVCLFLEDWQNQRENVQSYGMSQADYRRWQDQTLAYYAATPVECAEPAELSEDERLEKRKAYLNEALNENQV